MLFREMRYSNALRVSPFIVKSGGRSLAIFIKGNKNPQLPNGGLKTAVNTHKKKREELMETGNFSHIRWPKDFKVNLRG